MNSEANRVLSDANDCLSTQVPLKSGFTCGSSDSSTQHDLGGLVPQNSISCPNSLGIIDTMLSETTLGSVKQSSSDPRFSFIPTTPFHETDRGMRTLLNSKPNFHFQFVH